MDRIEAELKLKSIFGLDHFYDEQWRAIDKILKGERILMIERTGFGKSLCYQFPATQFPGVTVVFSPLIALMRDQVRSLQEKGVKAAYINSEQSPEDNTHAINDAIDGKVKILYIAPERQENQEWIDATRRMNLSMVVIDEAHTISTWGHDFRPAFRRIINLVRLLPANMPILAVTATATLRVQRDIEEQIGGKLTTIRGNLMRPNFNLYVIRVKSEDEKMIWLASNINGLEGTGLVYTGTRVNTEQYAKWLQYVGIDSTDYNAGLDADTRKKIELGLIDNRWKCVVSTNALGMGIDKPDIRFIVHTQIPASPIHYYQEIGRAGRDGKKTQIILLYNDSIDTNSSLPADCMLPNAFIEGARPTVKKYTRVIELLKEEPLGVRDLTKKANLKQNQVRVIKADLIEQGIVREVMYGKSKKYEYQHNAPELDVARFEELRKAKLKDLESMVGYVLTTQPRMQYLCSFLDSNESSEYMNCDNTNLTPLAACPNPLMEQKLKDFRDTYFPILDLADATTKVKSKIKIKTPAPNKIEVIKDNSSHAVFDKTIDYSRLEPEDKDTVQELLEKHLTSASRLTDGYAASYYGSSNIGAAIHHSKYEQGGDFPDFLLRKVLSVFNKKYNGVAIDMVLYVPPTVSGDLVRNFAIKLASVIKVPISHELVKNRTTQEQKIFQNKYSKRDNVAEAFDISESIVRGKTILLLDDIYDSGATLKEIGKMLTQRGAKCIVPLVIAKTTGGTL